MEFDSGRTLEEIREAAAAGYTYTASSWLAMCREVLTVVDTLQAENERLREALTLRQGYMCCYPPEPCERCLADKELLKEEQQ